jgi:hypothetical protein
MGTSMSVPMRGVQAVGRMVLTIIEEIRESRILENPIFEELRTARDSYPQRQGGRAPTAEGQGEEWEEEEEEEDITLDAGESIMREEAVERQATRASDATWENIEETHSRQTVAAEAGRGASGAGTYVSEEITQRRLYEAPGRRAAVLEMRSGRRHVSGTKSTDEGEKTFVI